MPEKQNFEQTHPLYDAAIRGYERNAALYDGGKSIESPVNARRFLTQHPYEKDRQFAIRLRRAAYRNYAAPTVDLFASSVMDGAKREGLEKLPLLAPLLKDCDRMGTPPERFFKSVDTRAAAVGSHFVLVDMPPAKSGAATRGEAEGLGLLPYFVSIPAEDVIAWDFAPDGGLDWVVVRGIGVVSKDGPFSGFEEETTLTLWTREGWRRYARTGSGKFEHRGSGSTTLGAVPLVPFIYELESPMTGRSVIDDVASLILRVFNQDSELDKMLFDAALPILAAFGLKDMDEEEALVKATSTLWRFARTDARLEYVEPSGSSFSAKRQQILDDIESIREISLRQTRPKGAQVESAEAKRLDSVQISSQLGDFARNAAAAEYRCWELAGLMAGLSAQDMEDVHIKYNESFDPESLKKRLAEAYMALRKSGDISRRTLLTTLGMTPEEVEAEEELLEQERQQAAEAQAAQPEHGDDEERNDATAEDKAAGDDGEASPNESPKAEGQQQPAKKSVMAEAGSDAKGQPVGQGKLDSKSQLGSKAHNKGMTNGLKG